MTGGTIECVKVALRQTKDGITISFVIHPNDVSPELTALPIGARVAIRWAELTDEHASSGNDEAAAVQRRASAQEPLATAAPQGGEETAATSQKQRRRFADLPPSQQAALRCQDMKFWSFLMGRDHIIIRHKNEAADRVRSICNVKSRSEFDDGALSWHNLNSEYESWLTTQQHAEHYR